MQNTIDMDLTHFTSDTLRSLLNLTEAKEELLRAIQEVENDIAKLFTGSGSSVVATKGKKRGRKPKTVKATAKVKAPNPAKPEKKKRNVSPEVRAKMAAMMKARWEAKRVAASAVGGETPTRVEGGQP